jgi:zeta-carotene desaturase
MFMLLLLLFVLPRGFEVAAAPGDAAPETKLFDVVVAAADVPGIQKLLPEDFRKHDEFDKIYKLDAVPVQTVQLRFNGWVTEMQDPARMRDINGDKSDQRIVILDILMSLRYILQLPTKSLCT